MPHTLCRCGAVEVETRRLDRRTGVRFTTDKRLPRFLLTLGIALLLAGCAGRSGRPPAPSGSTPAPHAGWRTPAAEHLVQRGETLAAIGRRYGTDYLSLARLNGIRAPYTIYPGQRLRLPGPAGPAPAPVAPAGGWMWPTAGSTVRGFSAAHGGNKGLDIAGRVGQPVRAAAAGSVVYAGSGLRQYGNLLIVKHSEDYLSAYGHLEKIAVAEGAAVAAGQTIASMGSVGDGRGVLHFEIRYRGTPVDPARVLPPSGS